MCSAQAAYHGVRAPDEIGSIVETLQEVSRRKSNDSQGGDHIESPAAKLAKALAEHRDFPTNQGAAPPDGLPAPSRSQPQQPSAPSNASHLMPSTVPDMQGIPANLETTSPSSGTSPGMGLHTSWYSGATANSLAEDPDFFPQLSTPQDQGGGNTRLGAWPMANIGPSGRSAAGYSLSSVPDSSGL